MLWGLLVHMGGSCSTGLGPAGSSTAGPVIVRPPARPGAPGRDRRDVLGAEERNGATGATIFRDRKRLSPFGAGKYFFRGFRRSDP